MDEKHLDASDAKKLDLTALRPGSCCSY